MDSKDSKTENRKKLYMTEGILLAFVPAMMYLITYYFERGYARYFGLALDLVQVTFSSVLNTFVFISSLAIFTLLILNLTILLLPRRDDPVYETIRLNVIFFVVGFSYIIYAFGLSNWREWLPYTLLFLLPLIFILGVPLLNKGSSYSEKFDAAMTKDENVKSLFDYVISSYGPNALLPIIGFLLLPSIAGIAGRSSALTQETFIIVNTVPESVVIRNYDGNLIVAPFERQASQVESIFLVIEINEHPELLLKPEDVGPLEVVEPVTSSIIIQPTMIPTSTPSP